MSGAVTEGPQEAEHHHAVELLACEAVCEDTVWLACIVGPDLAEAETVSVEGFDGARALRVDRIGEGGFGHAERRGRGFLSVLVPLAAAREVGLVFGLPDEDVVVGFERSPDPEADLDRILGRLSWDGRWTLLGAINEATHHGTSLHRALERLARAELPAAVPSALRVESAVASGRGNALFVLRTPPGTEADMQPVGPCFSARAVSPDLSGGGEVATILLGDGAIGAAEPVFVARLSSAAGPAGFCRIAPRRTQDFGQAFHEAFARAVLGDRAGAESLLAADRAAARARIGLARSGPRLRAGRASFPTVVVAPVRDDPRSTATVALALPAEDGSDLILFREAGSLMPAPPPVLEGSSTARGLAELAALLRREEADPHVVLVPPGLLPDDRLRSAVRAAVPRCRRGLAVELPTTEDEERVGLLRLGERTGLDARALRIGDYRPVVARRQDLLDVLAGAQSHPSFAFLVATLREHLGLERLDLPRDALPVQVARDVPAPRDDAEALLGIRLVAELAGSGRPA